MKKTIFLLALGLSTVCLTSCSRGYGCPYTMETKMNKIEKTEDQSDSALCIETNTQDSETTVIAD